jgi:hypothetical protein
MTIGMVEVAALAATFPGVVEKEHVRVLVDKCLG